MRVRFRDFAKGWWPMGAPEAMPPATLRRAEGVNSIRTGILRSRWGSTFLYVLAAHSLFRFRDVRYQGVGQGLYKDGVLIRGSLSGDRLTFVAMPPAPGSEDWLFVAGGGVLFKVSPAGIVSQWGISAPLTNPVATVGAAGALTGVYNYAVTFYNSATGVRSNPNPGTFTGTYPTASPAAQMVDLTLIPVSTDPQVTTVEIWRTAANLPVFFKLIEIPNGTTSYTDNLPDSSLQPLVLPLDNARPEDTFGDAIGPYLGRMWWDRDSATGSEGRIFYSVIGYPESVEGFIEVNNGDDPTQKAVFWGGAIYVFTNGKIIQVIGQTVPFTWREVYGSPGTTQPFSVIPTPAGIVYASYDGIRIFDGTQSTLLGFDAIAELLTGEAMQGVPAFVPVVGAYTGREVWLSNEEVTLMIELRSSAWRYVFSPLTALYFEPDTQVLVVSSDGGTGVLDVIGQVTDAGLPIAFEVQTPGTMVDVSVKGMVVRLYFDVNTRGNLLTPTVVIDNDEFVLPPFKTDERPDPPVEIKVGRWGHVFSVRLEGSLVDLVDVFGIEADVYVPTGTTTS